MSPKFGTSGLRGLVVDLTDTLVAAHVRAFLAACETGGRLCVGRDLRPSSPDIAAMVARTARKAGVDVIECGALATPALALAASHHLAAAVMVTGSHIPADRNGLKFYSKGGAEITKEDEAAILGCLDDVHPDTQNLGDLSEDAAATARFEARYVDAFGSAALAGWRIGIYEHSAVARDTLRNILSALGADVQPIARSDTFIPVDTEAVDADTREKLSGWVASHRLDALLSTDGDSDRPLLVDERGQIVPGDVMGQIAARFLGAQTVVTPISSNSGVMEIGFNEVRRTRIGSPYVIAGMAGAARGVGYEANGGFLLGFEAMGPMGAIAPLVTRDCVLPILATLVAASGGSLSARVAEEPAIFTRADRLQDVPTEASRRLVAHLAEDRDARGQFLAPLGVQEAASPDLTDGLRLSLNDNQTLHIRPSGNAPELRLYVEAGDADRASRLLEAGLARLRDEVGR